ncbi:unnamed protein product, partial [Meganyctiphanes norvegica]
MASVPVIILLCSLAYGSSFSLSQKELVRIKETTTPKESIPRLYLEEAFTTTLPFESTMDESIEETITAPSTSGNQGTAARSTTKPSDDLPLSNFGAGPANVTYFKGADMEYF